jgi:hypothetical protein
MARTGSTTDPILVAAFLHAHGLLGMTVSRVDDPESVRVFLRHCQFRVIREEGFYVLIEMSRDLAARKRLVIEEGL